MRYQDRERFFEFMARFFAKVAPYLKPGTPALTKPLAPGLGWAEDPGADDTTMHWNSFGTHRCLLLADGMVRAYEHGKASLEERLRAVETRFRKEGVTIDEPFRNFRRSRRCRLERLAAHNETSDRP